MFLRLIKKVSSLLCAHYLILSTGLLLTLLILFPVIVFPFLTKNSYQGINIPPIQGYNAHEYLMRGKEVLDGHGLGSSSLRDGKNNPDYYFSISEYILVVPIRWLGLTERVDIVSLYTIENFIGIFILILFIYVLARQLSGNTLLAVTTALFVIGGYSLVYNKRLFYTDFNIYGRVIYPYIGSLFFFLYANLLVKSLRTAGWRYALAAGVSFGLLFYIYFFAWTFALALTGSVIAASLLGKDFTTAKKTTLIMGIGFLVGAYNMWRIFQFVQSPFGEKFSYFSLQAKSRDLIISKIGLATLGLWLICRLLKKKDQHRFLILGVIFSGWVVLNQQVLTGRVLQYGHYYWFFIVPVSIIIGLYMVWLLLKYEPYRTWGLIGILGVVFLNTAVGQYRSALIIAPDRIYQQSYRPIINYLNTISSPTVILAADDVYETLLAIYTPHDLFWYSFALMDTTPIERAKHALLVYLYLNSEARLDVAGYVHQIMADAKHQSYTKSLYKSVEGYSSGLDYDAYCLALANNPKVIAAHRAKLLKELNTEYMVMVSQGVEKFLKRYGVEYIVLDKNNNPTWDIFAIPGLELEVSNNNIYLYRLP